ncbi:MAG: hypothetical protein PF517_06170 [Salinivirgaceae bacterium]|jgi:hypothetical protein|nr:hypothetical protein [Salinivirgaceae bacterium]
MKISEKNRIFFESRIELGSEFIIIETFPDGSQLVRKNGFMIIIESTTTPSISEIKLRAKPDSYSTN